MARRITLVAEVLDGRDQPAAEERVPLAVDRDPRRERVVGGDEPVCQRQPVSRPARRQLREERGHGSRHLLLGLRVFATVVEKRLPRIVGGPLPQHEGRLAAPKAVLQIADLLDRLGQLRSTGQKASKHLLPLEGRPLLGCLGKRCFDVGRMASGLRIVIRCDRKPEAAETAGEMPLEPHDDFQWSARGQWLGQLEHGRMGPALPAACAPAARHLAIDRLRGGASGLVRVLALARDLVSGLIPGLIPGLVSDRACDACATE